MHLSEVSSTGCSWRSNSEIAVDTTVSWAVTELEEVVLTKHRCWATLDCWVRCNAPQRKQCGESEPGKKQDDGQRTVPKSEMCTVCLDCRARKIARVCDEATETDRSPVSDVCDILRENDERQEKDKYRQRTVVIEPQPFPSAHDW